MHHAGPIVGYHLDGEHDTPLWASYSSWICKAESARATPGRRAKLFVFQGVVVVLGKIKKSSKELVLMARYTERVDHHLPTCLVDSSSRLGNLEDESFDAKK